MGMRLLHAMIAQLVERHVANVQAAGSSPVHCSERLAYTRPAVLGKGLSRSEISMLLWLSSSYGRALD